MYEKGLPPQSMDMQFARPEKEKSQCSKCKFRKPDDVIIRADGSRLVIEQWDNNECEIYLSKPVGVVFGDASCEFFKKTKKQ